jgi:tetratricopeptide (TPR) repeat protein
MSDQVMVKSTQDIIGTRSAAKAIEETFLEAAAADPKWPQPYILLGHFYTLMKDLPKAHRSLTRAEALGSKDPWLYLNWAAYHKKNNEPLKVLEMAERAVATGKANKKALGSAYFEMIWVTAEVKRDRKRADQIYDEMIALNPGNAWTRGNYARQVIVGFGDFAAAEALALEALAIMQYPHAMQTLSMALYGQWAAAIDRQNLDLAARMRARSVAREEHEIDLWLKPIPVQRPE